MCGLLGDIPLFNARTCGQCRSSPHKPRQRQVPNPSGKKKDTDFVGASSYHEGFVRSEATE